MSFPENYKGGKFWILDFGLMKYCGIQELM